MANCFCLGSCRFLSLITAQSFFTTSCRGITSAPTTSASSGDRRKDLVKADFFLAPPPLAAAGFCKQKLEITIDYRWNNGKILSKGLPHKNYDRYISKQSQTYPLLLGPIIIGIISITVCFPLLSFCCLLGFLGSAWRIVIILILQRQ